MSKLRISSGSPDDAQQRQPQFGPRRADAPEETRPFVYLTPEPGTVFMWESWLRHEVPANRAKTDRISISFNYGWA